MSSSVSAAPSLSESLSPVLVIGAAYTGKSELAHHACQAELKTLVIGTADISEGLLQARVEELRRQRPPSWEHVQGDEDLGRQISEASERYEQILLDSINQWVAFHLLQNMQKYSLEQLGQHIEFLARDLVRAVEKSPARIVLVSSEVGAGITPPKAIARHFRQLVSRINCQLAAVCPSVVLVSAGIPMMIKGLTPTSGLQTPLSSLRS